MLGLILFVVLVIALLGTLPNWPHNREWGYAPISGVAVLLLVVVILLILGRI
jgi:hypothetical protein